MDQQQYTWLSSIVEKKKSLDVHCILQCLLTEELNCFNEKIQVNAFLKGKVSNNNIYHKYYSINQKECAKFSTFKLIGNCSRQLEPKNIANKTLT